jgi:guanosine-3',5'-bis(diphosphate) 3'-pyrophosphohydrolase
MEDQEVPRSMIAASTLMNIRRADKTSSLRAIATSPPAEWSVQPRLDYVEWARRVVAGLRGVNPSLEVQFDEAAKRADQSVQPKV